MPRIIQHSLVACQSKILIDEWIKGYMFKDRISLLETKLVRVQPFHFLRSVVRCSER